MTRSLFLVIPAVIILIVVFPIVFEIKISYNPIINRGVIAVFFYKFKILYYKFEIHTKYILLQNDNETKKNEIEIVGPQFALIEEFYAQVKDKIKLSYIYVYYNIGLGDALNTAMVCGSINQILNLIFVNIKSRKPTSSLCIYDTIAYNREVFEVAARTKMSISLFDLVYSFVYSYIITKIAK